MQWHSKKNIETEYLESNGITLHSNAGINVDHNSIFSYWNYLISNP